MRLTELQLDMLRALDLRPYRFSNFALKFQMYGHRDEIRANLDKLACLELIDIEDDSYSLSDKGADYLKAKPNVVAPRQITNASSRDTLQAIVMTPVRADPSRDLKSLLWSPDRERQKPDESMRHGVESVRQPAPIFA